MRREQGFTLIELLVAMAMFVFVMASVSTIFTSLLTQFKQQSRMGETQIEGVIGLEILRRDIKHAGFGLPWRMNGATYTEAVAEGAGGTPWVDRVFNDGPPDNPARGTDAAGASNAPGAIRSDNLGLYSSDVLVLKAANLAINGASQKWTRQGAGDVKRNGPPDDLYDPLSGDAFCAAASADCTGPDRVIVISPGNSDATRRGLVLSNSAVATSWRTTYDATAAFAPTPLTSTDINIIYGIRPAPDGGGAVSATDPRMPFNRTEYYIKIPTTSPMPNQCAAGTGILYRSELSHATGTHTGTEDPLLDCVADFQIVYTTNIAGVTGVAAEDYTNGLTAAQIRTQIRTVTVYILAQEGQKDPDFTFVPPTYTLAAPANSVRVGPLNSTTLGRDFNFATNGITDWQNYRWKVYTLTVTLENTG